MNAASEWILYLFEYRLARRCVRIKELIDVEVRLLVSKFHDAQTGQAIP